MIPVILGTMPPDGPMRWAWVRDAFNKIVLASKREDVLFGLAGVSGMVFSGAGAPTITAPQGSLYLRTDGSASNNRAYINTDGGTTWTSIATAA